MSAATPESHFNSQQLGRRQRKAIAARQAMFAAGLNAFERLPIGLVSVLDITDAADMAKGVFYLHFNSKDDYLLALLEHLHDRFLGRILLPLQRQRSMRGRIAAVIREHQQFVLQEPAAARFRIRMTSYFNDEVSGPQRLEQLRMHYIDRLAAMTGISTRSAIALDALCWSFSIAHAHYHASILDSDSSMITRLVNCILQTEAVSD